MNSETITLSVNKDQVQSNIIKMSDCAIYNMIKRMKSSPVDLTWATDMLQAELDKRYLGKATFPEQDCTGSTSSKGTETPAASSPQTINWWKLGCIAAVVAFIFKTQTQNGR